MNNTLSSIVNGEVWGDPILKAAWKFLTDDEYKCDDIRDRIEESDKDARIQAQKAARAEYVQWISSELAINPDVHESDIREKYVVRYWNRVAEILGR